MAQRSRKKNFRLLTWNLWFDEQLQVERLHSVLSYIVHLQPDIIAFQELTFVSENFFDNKTLPFNDIYHKVPKNIVDKSWYWEGIYTRFEFNSRFTRIPFQNSKMGRGLTIVHFPELDLVVGSTHLESEDKHETRRLQFSEALDHFSYFQTGNKIIAGDTNVREEEDVNDLLPENWADAWEELMPNDPGYTVDSGKNPMGPGDRRQRLDRVFYCCRDFKPQRIRLVGTDPVKKENETFFPSDHFGLLVDFLHQ